MENGVGTRMNNQDRLNIYIYENIILLQLLNPEFRKSFYLGRLEVHYFILHVSIEGEYSKSQKSTSSCPESYFLINFTGFHELFRFDIGP